MAAPSIRFARLTDAAGIRAIYAPYCESTCVSFETVAPNMDEMRERINRVAVQHPWLVCEVGGQIVGYVYASQFRERAAYRWAVEVAIYVATDYHGHGVGRALYHTLFSILRYQGYFKAFAGISLPNDASVGLHERMGFRPAAVFRGVGYKCERWIDVGWWQLELQEARSSPPDPRPFNEVRDCPDVAAILTQSKALFASKATPR
ncbi:MAG TPA: arsinothricin resistance N-acetyltransferase ArsN1 family B [Lacipirellulaceae bacterium]|nr:arsinothricin resistance N-acetyltransferase ArsN1 family B [Lacipirellulaceae bacterium]